jgi:hypothetical protein
LGNTIDSDSFENVCNLCRYFYSNSGRCSRINLNVRDNPKSFVEKCDGKLFIKNEEQDSAKIRFKTLLSLGEFVSFFGWIVVVASVIFIAVGINSIQTLGAIAIVGGAISLINGILIVCVGQLVSCFVSIEHNTYETNSFVKSMQVFQNKNSR